MATFSHFVFLVKFHFVQQVSSPFCMFLIVLQARVVADFPVSYCEFILKAACSLIQLDF